MRILFLSGRPFGEIGTPGTYKLVEEFSKNHETMLISLHESQDTVYKSDMLKHHIKVEKLSALSVLNQIETIEIFEPDLIWFFNYREWFEITPLLKIKLIEYIQVLDIKTPLLVRGKNAKWIKTNGYLQQNNLDYIFSLDEYSTTTWIPNYSGKQTIYPLGIDLNKEENSEEKYLSKDTVNCVFIGAIDKKRKIKEIIKGFISFSKYINYSVKLDIYGSGNELSSVKRLIEELGGQDLIDLKGLVSSEVLKNELIKYDIGIAWVPTERYDTSPSLKILEYFDAGLKVCATATQAHLNLLEEGYDVTFHLDTPSGLARGLYKTIMLNASSKDNQLLVNRTRSYQYIYENYLSHQLKLLKKKNTFLKSLVLFINLETLTTLQLKNLNEFLLVCQVCNVIPFLLIHEEDSLELFSNVYGGVKLIYSSSSELIKVQNKLKANYTLMSSNFCTKNISSILSIGQMIYLDLGTERDSSHNENISFAEMLWEKNLISSDCLGVIKVGKEEFYEGNYIFDLFSMIHKIKLSESYGENTNNIFDDYIIYKKNISIFNQMIGFMDSLYASPKKVTDGVIDEKTMHKINIKGTHNE